MAETTKYILIVGDPVDGYEYYGPFDDHETAEKYGDKRHNYDSWWVVALERIEEEP